MAKTPATPFKITDGDIAWFEISKLAYELYKAAWIHTQTTLESRKNTIIAYYQHMQSCLETGLEPQPYEEWLLENGFNGKIYVNYEEFCDEEYHDKDYICQLLNNDKTLLKLYYLDIDNDTEP